MWLPTPKGATPDNYTPVTDRQVAARRDKVINVMLYQVLI